MLPSFNPYADLFTCLFFFFFVYVIFHSTILYALCDNFYTYTEELRTHYIHKVIFIVYSTGSIPLLVSVRYAKLNTIDEFWLFFSGLILVIYRKAIQTHAIYKTRSFHLISNKGVRSVFIQQRYLGADVLIGCNVHKSSSKLIFQIAEMIITV